MNTKKEVLSRMPKAEKVELALVDDVNALHKKAFDLYDVQGELLDAQDKVKKSMNVYEEMLKQSDIAIQRVKELGAGSDMQKLFENKSTIAKAGLKAAQNLFNAIDRAITIL